MSEFHHAPLKLLNPSFDSPLVDVLTELEQLRRLHIGGTTPAPVFLQLKQIFHMLESLGSARIEWTVEPGGPLSERFVRELHSMAVRGLAREPTSTPCC